MVRSGKRNKSMASAGRPFVCFLLRDLLADAQKGDARGLLAEHCLRAVSRTARIFPLSFLWRRIVGESPDAWCTAEPRWAVPSWCHGGHKEPHAPLHNEYNSPGDTLPPVLLTPFLWHGQTNRGSLGLFVLLEIMKPAEGPPPLRGSGSGRRYNVETCCRGPRLFAAIEENRRAS